MGGIIPSVPKFLQNYILASVAMAEAATFMDIYPCQTFLIGSFSISLSLGTAKQLQAEPMSSLVAGDDKLLSIRVGERKVVSFS